MKEKITLVNAADRCGFQSADSTSERVVYGRFWQIICSELLALVQSSVKLVLLKRVIAADGELQRKFEGKITENGGPCYRTSGLQKLFINGMK